MDNAQIIRDAVREKEQIITGLNRSVWEYAELGYQETKSPEPLYSSAVPRRSRASERALWPRPAALTAST